MLFLFRENHGAAVLIALQAYKLFILFGKGTESSKF